MSDTEKHTDKPPDNKSKWQPLWELWSYSGVRALIACACVVLAGIGLLAYNTPDPSQRTNILTVGILGVITFVVSVITAISTIKMAEIMERQESDIEKQRIAAETQNVLTEQSIELARLSAKITEDQLQLAKLTQRPEIDLRVRFGIDYDIRRIEMVIEAPNVGHSTAYNFGIHISPAWQPKNYNGKLEYVADFDESSEPVRVGSPNFVHPQAIVFKDVALFQGFFTGVNWYIVYGIYWFFDGAGNRYEEVFCRRLNHLDPENAVQCDAALRSKVVPLVPDESSQNAAV